MVKLTIKIDLTLPDLKKAYRHYYGYEKTETVKKSEIVSWLSDLAQADVMDCLSYDDKEE